MRLEDWLDDLCVRFIVNLPREELESVERICFQVEEAQWFYEDFIRPLDPSLPSMSLRQFCLSVFQHCPLFSEYDVQLHSRAFSEFLSYKTRVPVRGAILLNDAMTDVVLVKGWKKGANWGFPRGKINKDERDIDCAVREVYEETGYDVRAAGLIGGNDGDESDAKYIEITMREQHMMLFVFTGVPMDTHFEPRTRKEISDIRWYRLSELPTLKKTKAQQAGGQELAANANKFYMVAPFLEPLKRLISGLRKTSRGAPSSSNPAVVTPAIADEPKVLASSVPVVQQPPGGDMNRLIGQLRQSKQASRENNLPEVSLPLPLQPSPVPAAVQAQAGKESQARPDAATIRQNKANAIMALLRSGGGNEPVSERATAPEPQVAGSSTPLLELLRKGPGSSIHPSSTLGSSEKTRGPSNSISTPESTPPRQGEQSGVQDDDKFIGSPVAQVRRDIQQMPTALHQTRSPQQEALLKLFKGPPNPKRQSPSLANPSIAAELSANTSPTNIITTSEQKSDGRHPQPHQPHQPPQPHQPVDPRKALASIDTQSKSSLPYDSLISATVTGPLNTPQFDQIRRHPPNASKPLQILKRPPMGGPVPENEELGVTPVNRDQSSSEDMEPKPIERVRTGGSIGSLADKKFLLGFLDGVAKEVRSDGIQGS